MVVTLSAERAVLMTKVSRGVPAIDTLLAAGVVNDVVTVKLLTVTVVNDTLAKVAFWPTISQSKVRTPEGVLGSRLIVASPKNWIELNKKSLFRSSNIYEPILRVYLCIAAYIRLVSY